MSDSITTFKSRHGGNRCEFELFAGRVRLKFQQEGQHLNERSMIKGEKSIPLQELNPDPAQGTIRVRRAGLFGIILLSVMGVVFGTKSFQDSHGHTQGEWAMFLALMVLSLLAVVVAFLFAWKTVKFRVYAYQTGVEAFTVIQGNRRDEEFLNFCDTLEGAIKIARS